MVGVVKEIDGQKVIVPMSGGNGNPLGTIIAVYSNVCPAGYLPCGVDFDENQYPALFALLGTNHTPEEGFEMDWANAESVTLSTSDYVVTKNGWLVGYILPVSPQHYAVTVNGVIITDGAYEQGKYVNRGSFQIAVKKGDVIKTTGSLSGQNVNLVPYKYRCCIKARSGLDEMQQDYVLNALNEAGSYSTEEVATGKKWIDGKTIYRRVFDVTPTTTGMVEIADTTSWNINYVTSLNGLIQSATWVQPNYYASGSDAQRPMWNKTTQKLILNISSANRWFIFIEYTKTT